MSPYAGVFASLDVKSSEAGMPFTIRYQSDGGVVTTYEGLVSEEDMLSSARERTTPIEKVDSYRYLLSDFTGVSELAISGEGVRLLARITEKMIQQNPNIRLAVVVPTDFEFGVSRMWQTLTKGIDEKAGLFRGVDKAVEWLGELP